MTINKCQGHSLEYVDLYLLKNVLNHIQLYVAISRIKNLTELKILIYDKHNKTLTQTINIVFKKKFSTILYKYKFIICFFCLFIFL